MSKHLEEIDRIVREGLCHRCGSCSGICPQSVIRPGRDYFPEWAGSEEKCVDCGLCVAVCPGREFLFPEYRKRIFGVDRDPGVMGPVLKAFLGHSTDAGIRDNSTSGGIATQIPVFMLKTGQAQGAIVVRSDPSCPWRPAAFVARSESEIRAGTLSKYPACSLNHVFESLRSERGLYVVTGLPCHVHGLHKMMDENPSISDRIALIVGLFCHSCLDHDAVRDILGHYRVEESSIARLSYRSGKLPGYVRAELTDGRSVGLPFPRVRSDAWRPNAKECLTLFFKMYSPPRCRMCIDALAEFADISVGDPWIKGWQAEGELTQGFNFMLARTSRGLKALERAELEGAIRLRDVRTGSMLDPPTMAVQKRARAAYNISRRKKANRSYPNHGFVQELSMAVRLKTAFHAATYLACDRPRLRRHLMFVLLSPAGIPLVWLIFFRRRILDTALARARAFIARVRF